MTETQVVRVTWVSVMSGQKGVRGTGVTWEAQGTPR
jgi:hypothetical protein